jgi:O-succinylbenzoic acid--CoA ligase
MNDVGELTILGRVDAIINSGGEKIDPAEVEAAIRATGLVRDVVVFGVADAVWGEAVVAAIEPDTIDAEAIRTRLRGQLAAHKIPKRCISVASIPRSAAGKIDPVALRSLAGRKD